MHDTTTITIKTTVLKMKIGWTTSCQKHTNKTRAQLRVEVILIERRIKNTKNRQCLKKFLKKVRHV